ncbi:hypothetical protein K450DRAFT_225074 [Umbelopsis ramanniana AG]|uniref:FAS1 domain-containing protein n=1 Tax=Umbelopsis ramanniana AG TaxID=1314678 RepID=A0AAD5EGZ3_UMBRA|nr:uncharacterized protein K450DRAFT_225074 [Umbelopsis ramanniana AG]KAI8582845.1 hypothetical protein K450DRAFT_225074 [Umbelopsis ramanniana AG]
MYFKTSAVAAAAVLATSALAQSGNSLVDVITGNSDLSTLTALLTNGTFGNFSSLVNTLSNSTNGNWTIFAPSNSAFDGVQITNSTDLTSILSYHTINGSHPSSQFKDGSNIVATNLTNSTYDHFPSGGVPVNVKVSGSVVNVYYGANYANVTSADNTASNGVVHVINAVLMPPSDVNSTALQAGLDKFVNALNSTNSTEGINKKSGITIFAPNDGAFSSDALSKYNSSQLANILAYHVVEGLYYSTNLTNLTSPMNITTEAGSNFTLDVSGGSVKLTDVSGNETAHVIKTDILTDNGVIHIIDAILIPAQNASSVPTNNTNITSSSGVGSLFESREISRIAVAMTVMSAFAALML